MQETRQKSLKQLLRLMCEFPLFIFLFIYLIAMISMLKKTRGKIKTFEQDTKTKGRRCGTHIKARLQIKCAITESTQILTM